MNSKEVHYTIGAVIEQCNIENVVHCIQVCQNSDLSIEIQSIGKGMLRLTFPMTDEQLTLLQRMDPATEYIYAEMQEVE